MWGAMRGFVGAAVRSPRLALRALGVLLFIAAAVSITATDLQAQTIWNGYAGSNSVQISYATPAAQGVVPLISAAIGGATSSINDFMFDTGSTGITIDQGLACRDGMITCTSKTTSGTPCALGSTSGNCATYTGPIATLFSADKLSSSNVVSYGFWQTVPVTLCSSGTQTTGACANGTPMATATVPVLFVASGGAGKQFGVGFGRPETANVNGNGIAYYSTLQQAQAAANQLSNGQPVTETAAGQLYGRTLNPLLNLTSLSGQNLSSIAPGYVVTQNAVYLGLKPSQIFGTQAPNGPLVSLNALPQPGSSPPSALCATSSGIFTCANSSYAQAATKFDWQTPPMLMQVSNNTVGLNGNYYGSVIVDTGLAVGIITNGPCPIAGTTTGCVNQALVQSAIHSATPTNIAISLGGAGGSSSPPAQFVYVFQGVCNTPSTTGCGPSGTKYDGNEATINGQKTKLLIGDQSSQMIPMYPTSGGDSSTNGYAGTNTGFSDTNSAAAFLNTGVNFLSYFNIVYDPVNGFIGYVPISNASAPAGLVSVTPVLALQGTQQPIPDGTIVPWSVYLFTSTGQQTAQISAPVDVVLSVENGGTATFNGPISSDTICTNSNCSTSLSTGLVLSSGTFVLNNAINTYAGATTVHPARPWS
jgi:hypothetical protein